MYKAILIVAIIPIISFKSFSQSSFVRGSFINLNGDSITGKIEYLRERPNFKGFTFIDEQGYMSYLTAANVKLIYVGRYEIFEAKVLPGSKDSSSELVRWLVKGEVSLFETSKGLLYVVTNEDKAYLLTQKAQLVSLMDDNLTILLKIKESDLNKSNVIDIIKTYNYDQIKLEWSQQKVPKKYDFAPIVYLYGAGIRSSLNENETIKSSMDFTLGVGLGVLIYLPRMKSGNPLLFELGYSPRVAYYFNKNESGTVYSDIILDYSVLQLDLSKRFPLGALQGEVGIATLFLQNGNSYKLVDTLEGNVITNSQEDFSINDTLVGVKVGLGYEAGWLKSNGLSLWTQAGYVTDMEIYSGFMGELRIRFNPMIFLN